MKSRKLTSFVLFSLILLFVAVENGFSQCNPDSYCANCLTRVPDGFNFLKSYKIDGLGGQKNKIEYSYVLTKGTQYALNLCTPTEGADGIVVTLLDKERNQIASSKIDKQYLSQIAVQCGATGIYYIQYTFEGSRNFCGGSVLAYKR